MPFGTGLPRAINNTRRVSSPYGRVPLKGSTVALADHVIFSMYGFWLPNDPRGSWSDFVGSWELFRYGKATKVDTRRSVAGVPHDGRARRAAKRALKYPPATLTGRQARAVGRGFAQATREGRYAVHACSILPDHVHLVAGRHARSVG